MVVQSIFPRNLSNKMQRLQIILTVIYGLDWYQYMLYLHNKKYGTYENNTGTLLYSVTSTVKDSLKKIHLSTYVNLFI